MFVDCTQLGDFNEHQHPDIGCFLNFLQAIVYVEKATSQLERLENQYIREARELVARDKVNNLQVITYIL